MKPLVIAHRGYSSAFRENSLAGFDGAIAAGADAIETDIRLSSDGIPVCSHDADLKRIRGRDAKVSDLAASELEEEGILRLETVLSAMRGRTRVMLDLKLTTETELMPAFAVVERLGVGAAMFAGVRSIDMASVVRRLSPQATLLGLVRSPGELPAFHAAGGAIGRLWQDEATEAGVAAAKAGGLKVWVTAGTRGQGHPGDISADGLRRLFRLGVDGVIVNDVAQAVAVRDEAAS